MKVLRGLLVLAGMLCVLGLAWIYLPTIPASGPMREQRAEAKGVGVQNPATHSWAFTASSSDVSVNTPASADAAVVRLGTREVTVVANSRGEYPRLSVPAGVRVVAQVPFPLAAPGETIRVQAEDGGVLGGSAVTGQAVIDDQRRAWIEYRVSDRDGLQRVTLRRSGDMRRLEFWVGAEPPVLARN